MLCWIWCFTSSVCIFNHFPVDIVGDLSAPPVDGGWLSSLILDLKFLLKPIQKQSVRVRVTQIPFSERLRDPLVDLMFHQLMKLQSMTEINSSDWPSWFPSWMETLCWTHNLYFTVLIPVGRGPPAVEEVADVTSSSQDTEGEWDKNIFM